MIGDNKCKAHNELVQELKVQKLVSDAKGCAHGALIPDGEAASGSENLVSDARGGGSCLLCLGKGVQSRALVLVEVGVYGGRMHDDDMNAKIAVFSGDGCSEVRQERLRGAVHSGSGPGQVAGGGGGEGDQSAGLALDHRAEEVVSNRHGTAGIALHIDVQLLQFSISEETSANVSCVVEDQVDIDVGGLRDDLRHVGLVRCTEVDSDCAELNTAICGLKVRNGLLKQIVGQGNENDIDALLRQLLSNAFADTTAGAGNNSPLGVVLLLQILRNANGELLNADGKEVSEDTNEPHPTAQVAKDTPKELEHNVHM